MTETATAATISTARRPTSFGTVGQPLPGVELKIAEDGEVLIKGPNIFNGYHNERRRHVRRRRGRLAAHRRPRLDRRGRLPLDHRPQEGHHHHRRRQEPHAREHRERPQAEPLDLPGGDARRPPPLPGRADHARRGGDRRRGRQQQGLTARTSSRSRQAARGPRADPGATSTRSNDEVRPGRAGQEVRDPRPRPLAGDRRADADAEGQAQRRQREVRRHVRRALRGLSARVPLRSRAAQTPPVEPLR